jgi:Protein of unknown function (DUF2800).
MRAEALRRLEAGETVPGFKLVAKRATRKWVSEKQVETWLWDEKGMRAEEMYEPQQLRSPAQIEKLVGKKNLPQVHQEGVERLHVGARRRQARRHRAPPR